MNPLHRLGLATARHPWRTFAAWLLVLVAMGGFAASFGGELRDNWNVPDTRAQHGVDQLREHFPDAGGSSAQVVIHDGSRLESSVVEQVVADLEGTEHVTTVTSRLSEDGDTALFHVRYDVPTTDPDIYGIVDPLWDASTAAEDAGYQVELGGELPGTATEIEGRGELIGILVALALLVIAFGSVVAAGLPIAVAVGGLVAGSSGVMLLAGLMDVSTSAPTIATMVGLGVGIDYALLIVTRHVERLRAGDHPVDAAARATATAGRAVLGAGLTVLVSLMGLRLAGLPTYDAFGFATAITVICVMAAALTLVPALCALAGRRLMPRNERKARHEASIKPRRLDPSDGWTARWVRTVARKPVAWALVALTVLLALGAPALGMRTWPQDGGTDPQGSTTRAAYDLVTDEYGAGANGPITLVADLDQLDRREVETLHSKVAGLDEVAHSTPVVTSPDGRLAVWDIEPTTSPIDEETTAFLGDLRADVLPDGVEATGYTPILGDISELLQERLWLVVGFVVLVSVLLLMVLFRSVVVPLKAAAMNLLSIAAAYGVVTLVFQHGWGSGLLGVDHAIPVSSWVPILMFAVLFGLSMDYEVFLLSAVRDDWLDTGDARGSVVRGLASTGRVISMAAAIMVAVFLGFATESAVVVKMLGVGLAAAVALDATVVRMVLVPATMTLLGQWNWWMPGQSRLEELDATPTPIP
ncbi:MMPL family transporter [Nocardioides bizhenqiangii]|uniref:MMPL family transporter n=1 Tax=Nocardioides bizhenqiangii TaxID=3095076 RepID=A0ABZ0ZPZ5_9ACTN|nr:MULTISPECIES: MMPL family transporter [unclassified Nocardioides]MDZ5619635.1 MMPL family transporter [Nocardioides sp. HM23]WQQ26353.1 MMPL family transporter [Nocardioides sp. HM61]